LLSSSSTLHEAKVMSEQWRRHYNGIRPRPHQFVKGAERGITLQIASSRNKYLSPAFSAAGQSSGKIEQWHQTLENRILVGNYCLPGDLEARAGRRR
jgi:hypothetical protein